MYPILEYKDSYGNIAYIYEYDNKLRIFNYNGKEIMNKKYNTLRGAKIALGRYGEGDFKLIENNI